MSQLLRRLIVLQSGETPALLASFATLLCMFASYTILRPVRDALGITSGLETIPYLFWGVFAVMLLLQPLYGWLTSRFPRSVFLPWVYGFFALNLLIFWVWFRVQTDHTWIARTYFVWVSVFNLFVVAAFWSLMAQVFRWQRRRAASGPQAAAAIAAGGAAPRAQGGVGGGVFAAFGQVVRSPYLLGIAAFVLLMTWVSTFLYLEQQAFVAKVFSNANERTRFFAGIDFYVQAASLTIQFLLFGRLFKWLGMRSLLASVPLLMTAGYALFALTPVFTVLVLVYAVRRVADYAITRPCRDSLFTVVSREEKYQAKSLIDTFAYRGGDALSGSLYKGLTGGLGAGPAAIGWLGAVISAVWTVLALALGRAFEQRGHSVRAGS